MLHFGHQHIQTLRLEVVAHLRQALHIFDDPAGHGGGIALAPDLEQVVHIVQIGTAGDQVAAVLLLLEDLDDLVMLIPDLAHQLLQNILQRDDTLGAAVLIHNHGHMGLVLLESAQQFRDLGACSGIEHRRLQVGDHVLAPVTGGIKVLLMDEAHDIVDGLVIDRDTGITHCPSPHSRNSFSSLSSFSSAPMTHRRPV